MAVYTEVPDGDLEAFVAQYDIGRVLSCKGIAEGVENSNFLLKTDQATWILTLYEKRVAPADLPFFLGLLDHLAGRGIACPTPVKAGDGDFHQMSVAESRLRAVRQELAEQQKNAATRRAA